MTFKATLSTASLALVLIFAAACDQGRTGYSGGTPTASTRAAPTAGSISSGATASVGIQAAPTGLIVPPGIQESNETYAEFVENTLYRAAETPVSTFGADVDTGAYSNVRRMLELGETPPKEAVRVEEMINYFDYALPTPNSLEEAFRVTTEMAPTPWNKKTKLLSIGVKAFEPDMSQRPAANLVFLIDVSGSMDAPNRLALVKRALTMLTKRLNSKDRVAIAVYAGAAGTVLEPTPGDQTRKIIGALNKLNAGGSTNGGEGLALAYNLARDGFIDGGINRVIIATDGDLNVGITDLDALLDLVRKNRDDIALTTLGFGMWNYNDHLLEQLADVGNGNHAYIDRLSEAAKVLSDQAAATLMTVAKDLKIQVEFNPAVVSEYRLIGYENRVLAREDFRNDTVDSGDVGAGHSVTALYEVALVGDGGEMMPPLRYSTASAPSDTANRDEVALVRVRYKKPGTDVGIERQAPVMTASVRPSLEAANEDLQFAAAVAGFGQKLRGGKYLASYSWDDIQSLAASARGADKNGYRSGFLELVRLAEALD